MVVIIGPIRRTEKKRENTIQLVMKMLWFCDFGDPKSQTTTMMSCGFFETMPFLPPIWEWYKYAYLYIFIPAICGDLM